MFLEICPAAGYTSYHGLELNQNKTLKSRTGLHERSSLYTDLSFLIS